MRGPVFTRLLEEQLELLRHGRCIWYPKPRALGRDVANDAVDMPASAGDLRWCKYRRSLLGSIFHRAPLEWALE
jgi:hypothetical protein